MTDASIALNRFGLGARPDEAPPRDPRRWLIDQFARSSRGPPRSPRADRAARSRRELADYLEEVRRWQKGPARAQPPDAPMHRQQPMRRRRAGEARCGTESRARQRSVQAARRFADGRGANYAARWGRGDRRADHPAPFVERLVHFWANHFAVSADKMHVSGLPGLLELEAIRPHVLGSSRHAVRRRASSGDAALSRPGGVGRAEQPRGRSAASRPRAARPKVGLNENLAREIMELHTLGVGTGYTQADVTDSRGP